MDADEADNLLRGKKVGLFLIRFSRQPGYFAGSYVDANNNVSKCLIASTPYFQIVEDTQQNKFASMRELVKHFSSFLKFPYKKSTNEVNNSVRKKIATEILDTERSYVRALHTTVNSFFNPILTANPALIPKEDAEKIFANTPQLLSIHQSFLAELEKIIPSWSEDSQLGHVFSNFVSIDKFCRLLMILSILLGKGV
jgi:hypothetical protein